MVYIRFFAKDVNSKAWVTINPKGRISYVYKFQPVKDVVEKGVTRKKMTPSEKDGNLEDFQRALTEADRTVDTY